MGQNELLAKIREMKELQQIIDEAAAEIESIKDELKAVMTAEGKEEMTVDVFKVRFQTITSSRFDSAAFKKTHADLYAQFTKPTTSTRFTIA